MEEVIRFLDALKENPEMQALLKDQPKPANDEEAAAVYACIAEKAGYSVTKEDILRAQQDLESRRKKQTEADTDRMKVALEEDDLDQVAGGEGYYLCDSTYRVDGEWCWFSDSCSAIVLYYDDDKKREADAWVDAMGAEVDKKVADYESGCSATATCSETAAWTVDSSDIPLSCVANHDDNSW